MATVFAAAVAADKAAKAGRIGIQVSDLILFCSPGFSSTAKNKNAVQTKGYFIETELCTVAANLVCRCSARANARAQQSSQQSWPISQGSSES